jgi:coenzyme F420 hydrogenase subunit delta
METTGATPTFCRCRTLILGCGNDLFGDDGFGREVARRLSAAGVPDAVCVVDAGTSVRHVLFDVVLSEIRPEEVVVVDAVDVGREPGSVFEIGVAQIPFVKLDDFSMHQIPTSNLLRELENAAGVRVTCLVCQVESVPVEVRPGLSAVVERAVDEAVRVLSRRFGEVAPADRGKEQGNHVRG